MPEIEPSNFCTIKEYKGYLEQRIQADELSVGGLYLVLAALKGVQLGKEAFKFPITLSMVEIIGVQQAKIGAILLDSDLRPKGKINFSMCDGISKDPPVKESSTSQSVAEMYIKGYEDYYIDLGGISAGQQTEAGELVLV